MRVLIPCLDTGSCISLFIIPVANVNIPEEEESTLIEEMLVLKGMKDPLSLLYSFG